MAVSRRRFVTDTCRAAVRSRSASVGQLCAAECLSPRPASEHPRIPGQAHSGIVSGDQGAGVVHCRGEGLGARVATLVRSRQCRDQEHRSPMSTVFEAGSVSKTVFAYAVLKLCEKGILSLDAPLTTYWSERPLTDPRVDLITVRRVLCHTTGLPNWRSSDTPLGLAFTPGEQWSYSGEGYWYLQSGHHSPAGSRGSRHVFDIRGRPPRVRDRYR